jgi:hypothetical protein
MDALRLETEWQYMSTNANSHGITMAGFCSKENPHLTQGRDLILAETRKFCDQSPPMDEQELFARRIQLAALESRVAIIGHANAIATLCPSSSNAIFAETRKFCGSRLPTCPETKATEHERRESLSSMITQLGDDDVSRRSPRRRR